VLLLKAAAIQLAANAAGYTLDDARASLRAAVENETDFAEGWLELGFFYHAVDDDLPLALQCFERAQALSTTMRNESIRGRDKVLADMGTQARELVRDAAPARPAMAFAPAQPEPAEA
jgi:hypothetical protein